MKVFLIIIAVLVLIFAIILSLSAEATVIYDNGWQTTLQVLFFKFDVELSKILNFILFPEKAGKEAAENKKSKKDKAEEKSTEKAEVKPEEQVKETTNEDKPAEKKPNMITKIIDNDGIVGIMLLASNLIETLNTAILTLFRGLHIYSLYVKIIVGGNDADEIARDYGDLCGFYYPIKGIILNGMKVDQYDDLIQPDFIAPQNEYEFQLIASLNIALLVKVALKAGKTFLVNFIKNK